MVNNLDLYLINTQLHYLQALGMAKSRSNTKKAILYIVRDYKEVENNFDKLRNWIENPFDEIILLNGRLNIQAITRIKLILDVRKNISLIQNSLNNSNLNNFDSINSYVFHDGNPEAQYLQYYSKKNGNSRNYYFQDGLDVYNSNSYLPQYSIFSKFLMKVLIGIWYSKTSILGLSPYTDIILMKFPKLVRNQLIGQNIQELDKNYISFLVNSFPDFVNDLIVSNNEASLPNNIQILILIPLSIDFDYYPEISKEIVKIRFDKIFNHLRQKYDDIQVKYHPRETENWLEDLIIKYQINEIDQNISFELFCSIQKNPFTLIGPNSTALLNAKLINVTNQIFMINHLLYGFIRNNQLEDLYSEFDIHVVNKLDDNIF